MRTVVEPRWKIGVELELVAPPGSSRLELARALVAHAGGGEVRAVFHPQSEPSKVPGQPIFHSLTLGFEALDAGGQLIARCVDDLTLQADLDRQRAARADWCRVVSDDERLLRILARKLAPGDVIEPGARLEAVSRELFGAAPIVEAQAGMVRLVDSQRAPIAIIARLPGERERPCEVVTPPYEGGLGAHLGALLSVARELGFTLAAEGATHLHFDAGRLCSAAAVSNLVSMLETHRETLRALLGHNPRWQRTGRWSRALVEAAGAAGFRELDWASAREALAATRPTKYCDFNLKNLVHAREDMHTVEIRTLPATFDVERIVRTARLFESLLERAVRAEPVAAVALPNGEPARVRALFEAILLSEEERGYWAPRPARRRKRR